MEQLQRDNEAYTALMANRLQKIRECLGMTQSELAKELKTTQNLIYRLENGLKVSLEMFTLITLYFIRQHQVNHDWLFTPDPDDESIIPMFTNEQQKKNKHQSLKETEKLGLLYRFLDDLRKIEQK